MMTAKKLRADGDSKRFKRPAMKKRDKGVKAIGFQVRSASGAAGTGSTNHLLHYSTRSCWQSYVRPKETLVLALETKTLLSEVRILNKNACAVSVSVATDNRPRSYLKDLTICRTIAKLQFERRVLPSIAVHAVQPMGIPSDDIETESGPSMSTVLSYTTELT
ncbi:hypothetical protein BBO99_00003470 [Phytophthora kernoviae]|uniref:DNA-repair protein Xrcc1 N-terminal domain-containing protein n=2 Tax=Phytophthora kernoviae TaxID=325452 RepID=A0A3R7MMY4_9STRA|nr:hypothetical protein G195_004903 [Phytophthora kernoviae 00238/432]KAG2519881.1 hypothetical protein JM18_007403 [Phytophthora kernoviae]KAG2525808.1 hypothetical protein JM16_003156 [Phytophthora kernoviae]RLN13725.1 hypothetical protein BBI17_003474 [Phytophthora kernoviae]RLN81751.1 hypothetical protein BBO99_00003470 [Phytophthora kernoviae]